LKADAQKVATVISGDKAKVQTYCHILDLTDELDEVDEQKDRKKAEDLSQKISELENTLGPEYLALVDSLKNMDPTSREGQEILPGLGLAHKFHRQNARGASPASARGVARPAVACRASSTNCSSLAR
jgi:hypothetical protein